MTVQHKSIPNAELHEPKDINTAVIHTAYVADGAGSGDWKKIDSRALNGLAGDGGIARLKLVTDGSNGFDLYPDYSFGKMQFAANTTPFPVTAAADSTLNTNSDYVLLTGSGAPFINGTSDGVVFSTNKLTMGSAGIYELSFWANISSYPNNTGKIAFKFKVNGTTFSTLNVIIKANSAGDHGLVCASDLIQFAATDYVQLYVASEATGNLTIHNLNLTAKMIKAL